MKISALNCIIPVPKTVKITESGSFHLNKISGIQTETGLERFACEAQEMLLNFGIFAVPNITGELFIGLEHTLEKESWQIQIGRNGILLKGGDESGIFYAMQALIQVIAAASECGPGTAEIEYGTVEDSPRFGWRGFMLDSARHFQSVKTLKRIIRMMAAYRLNVLHWHLTDDQGWRIGTGKTVSNKTSLNLLTEGVYSKKELREVAAYAKKYFISIVPEVDVPGHSRSLLHAYSELACDPSDPDNELCIGRIETLPFLKRIYAELMDTFSDSQYIHFGGDEAATTQWEKCPHCQAAMTSGGFRDLRELENHFMRELTRFAVENGRTPIVWGTGSSFPEDTIIQAWLDIREPHRHIGNGCKCIMSVHNSYYFDYPANLSEPHEPWMFSLSEESVYMADPYVIWEKEWKDHLLGPEACLWTETVPEWRIMQKILPRLGAYAETAWSCPERKDWYDFLNRSNRLRAAGYEDYLRFLE